MYTLVFVLVILVFHSSCCNARYQDYQGEQQQANDIHDNYDYLILSQSWPQTSCWGLNDQQWESIDSSCTICRKPRTETGWTVHGLWPTNRDGSRVGYCTRRKFNRDLLNRRLRSELEIKWPTYQISSSNDGFWRHEYEKHGSCAVDIDSADTLPEYFTRALELFDSYEIGKVLQESNIIPGREYNTHEVKLAIKQRIGVNTSLLCFKNRKTGDQYLAEIYLCFNRSFRLVDCSENSGTYSDCKYNKKIIYPRITKSC